jgi:DNA polymerase III alpha subunit
LFRLNYYNFAIIEVEDICYSGEERFDEDVIYEKAKELFSYKIPDTPSFSEIEAVNEILKDTEFKLIYQEQLIEILNKICGFDLSKADYFRREIGKAKRDKVKEAQQILTNKYGEKGKELFEYIVKVGRYTVSKAYVLANLHNLIKYADNN